MLFAPRIRPTFVPGLSWKPATFGAVAVAYTGRPVSLEAASSTIRARAVGGTTSVPGGNERPAANCTEERKTGTSAFCRSARKRATPYELGSTRYAPAAGGATGKSTACGVTAVTRSTGALTGAAIGSAVMPSISGMLSVASEYGISSGQLRQFSASG